MISAVDKGLDGPVQLSLGVSAMPIPPLIRLLAPSFRRGGKKGKRLRRRPLSPVLSMSKDKGRG